jgi:lipoyl(octanoyl) transferase
MSQAQWRLIIDSAYDGPYNMAVDEAILEAVGRGASVPTLRLYRWEPACLSLGYAQPITDVDLARLESHGWHLVRRMTGGRAILHTDELTYSVTLPVNHPLVEGSIPDSYRRISAALLHAVNQIGLDAQADKRQHGTTAPVGPVCFEVPSDYEITAHGKKLIGSAQVRKHNGALQHGSLPLFGDVSRIVETLVTHDEAEREANRTRVLDRAITLSDALGRYVDWDEGVNAVIHAFEETFDLNFLRDELSGDETARAAELRETRYSAEAWLSKL